MKKIIIPALFVSILFNFVSAEGKGKETDQPRLKELTLTGKITKKVTLNKNLRRNRWFKQYYLETSDSMKIRLSQSALGTNSKVDLDDFVNTNVVVRGKGYEKELNNATIQTYFQEIANLSFHDSQETASSAE